MQGPVILAVILAASLAGQPATSQKPVTPAQDTWVGTWAVVSGQGGRPNAVIEKDADGYRLRMPAYETQRFKEVTPGILECQHLGVIRRGKQTFPGVPGETVVLRAEFCYEIFYRGGCDVAASEVR